MFTFFLLAEGVTRLIMPNRVRLKLMHQADERLGYRLVPNYETRHQTSDFDTFIKINSEGLRDYEHRKDKDSTTFRILVLGDSITFGLGVNIDESYPKLLEAMLNQNLTGGAQKKYEVINAGVDGYGTAQEYLYLQELGNRYRPDLVIVGLNYNDVGDVMTGIPFTFTKTRIVEHFYVLSYLKSLRILLKKMKKIYSKGLPMGFFQIYQDQYTPEFEKGLLKTKEYLVKIRDFSYSMGSKMHIFIIPLCFELGRSEWEKRRFGHLYSDEFFDKNMHKCSEIFTEFGKVEKIPTLPLLPIFRKSKEGPFYFARDMHWNKKGHRLAAESIYNFLKEKGLLH
jgi:lysophospholipase L1-like esterase